MAELSHIPVLLAEVLDALNARAGGEFIDGTFGAGGYARGILAASPDASVVGFDRDPQVRPTAFGMEEAYRGRFSFVQDCFGQM
ncbi:MAG: 16S rRNA (cytosine(1402)-N(4))-methyltransferase, partial [Alphaproteobacteria bacterium]|nr:16S rRNA (cytosine(1402)-N(4))-methyltransferase [Alphaproteobacteria bacterium]